MASKKKSELKPVIIDNADAMPKDLTDIKSLISEDSGIMEIRKSDARDESDNFFRSVVTKMLNDEDISLKTEYMNVNENFSGAKLEFLAVYGNMPYLSAFIRTLEIKRVSLGRKSRIELIKAFERRDEEIQAQQRLDGIKSMFGMRQ
jgi:hypothetical protein